MAGPKGQLYVYNTYDWPEGPAIIPRDSYLGQRPNLFIKAVEGALDSAGTSCSLTIGPHHGRKLAASYGFLFCNSRVDELKLMQDMGYSSLRLMRQVYIREVPPLRLNCIVPGSTTSPDTLRRVPYRLYRSTNDTRNRYIQLILKGHII